MYNFLLCDKTLTPPNYTTSPPCRCTRTRTRPLQPRGERRNKKIYSFDCGVWWRKEINFIKIVTLFFYITNQHVQTKLRFLFILYACSFALYYCGCGYWSYQLFDTFINLEGERFIQHYKLMVEIYFFLFFFCWLLTIMLIFFFLLPPPTHDQIYNGLVSMNRICINQLSCSIP